MPDPDTDRELASLKQENSDPDSPDETTGRRGFLAAIVGVAVSAAGLVGYGAGRAEAATPSGEVGTAANPYLHAYVDRVVFTARTTDPSTPADGTLWYNENA